MILSEYFIDYQTGTDTWFTKEITCAPCTVSSQEKHNMINNMFFFYISLTFQIKIHKQKSKVFPRNFHMNYEKKIEIQIFPN